MVSFDMILTCKPEELQQHAEQISQKLQKEDVEPFIRTLWKRVPELSVEQEKKLHQLGRRILKRFNMGRIRD